MGSIRIRGARQNNLRGVDLDLPHGSLTVVTGLSGSGKSSLALDTLFAEGQRRFVESLSTYARQFLQRLPRPDVDRLEGIPPAIALERKSPASTHRSTVGTASEILDYLRLLYARVGRGRCRNCGAERVRRTVTGLAEELAGRVRDESIEILFPVHIHRGPRGRQRVADLVAAGFHRVRRGDSLLRLEPDMREELPSGETWVVVDRLPATGKGAVDNARMADSLETAFREGEGVAGVAASGAEPQVVRLGSSCPSCGERGLDPTPQLFSFNSPYGACSRCRGFGDLLDYDIDLIVPDRSRTLEQGAIDPWSRRAYRFYARRLKAFCEREGIPIDVPFAHLDRATQSRLLEGEEKGFRGAIPFLRRLERKRYRAHIRFFLRRYLRSFRCPDCGGARLRPEALDFFVGGANLGQLAARTIGELRDFFDRLDLSETERAISRRVLAEIRRRLALLDDLGLGYLTLDRLSRTLSGGEFQRIQLGGSLASGLTGSLYVLDEPTVGLHGRDTERLIEVLTSLRELGNTVVVVEHDRKVMEAADHLVELGPGAGHQGGTLVFAGDAASFRRADTLTSGFLRGDLRVADPVRERRAPRSWLTVRGAREHNLRNIDVRIPLGVMVAVTGVSGSGKTTLTRDVLYRALAGDDGDGKPAGAHDAIEGRERAGDMKRIDQSPIGNSPRSNPGTYVGALSPIRDVFAAAPLAAERGYKSGFFSFNVAGGRCEVCGGDGSRRVDMQFLADVYIPCEACEGTRFGAAAREVRVGGRAIHEVLAMTVEEAYRHFEKYPSVKRRLETLRRVGLGYLRLGQPAPTLSGGEAQRLKIARELDLAPGQASFYLLDEPTTGLHFQDVRVLLDVLAELVERGNTVLVVEHHPEVIAACDHVIDLGPEGGEGGGRVVACGTPEEVASSRASHTGRVLREVLAGRVSAGRTS